MIIFYARCSTAEQNEARQLGDAHACHAEKIYIDKASGKNRDRPQLEANYSILNWSSDTYNFYRRDNSCA